jgi:hypothetical protein
MEPEIILKSRAPNVPPHEHRPRLRRAPLLLGDDAPPDSDARCLIRRQLADTKRTHQKRHARRLATHHLPSEPPDLQAKACRA